MKPADTHQLKSALRQVLAPLAHYARGVGISRQEFTALATAAFERRTAAVATAPKISYDVAVRIVGRWLAGAKYTRGGRPRPLRRDGPASFATLLGEAAGGPPDRALAALRAAGAVRLRNGRVYLVNPAYVPARDASAKVDILGRAGREFLDVIIHNLTSSPKKVFCNALPAMTTSDLRV